MHHNEAYEADEDVSVRQGAPPRRNVTAAKGESVWKYVVIVILSFLCCLLLVALAAGIAIHLNAQSRWQKEIETLTSTNNELTNHQTRQPDDKSPTNTVDLQSVAEKFANISNELAEIKMKVTEIQNITSGLQVLGSRSKPASSCDEIKQFDSTAGDGLYYLEDLEGKLFQTYCAMTATGGWTLVASIHENNMTGRCTTGDRWSSEQGYGPSHPHGDGFWENKAIHGNARSASSDDYKNSGYFAMNAKNIMVWQVPNDTPLTEFQTSAFLKYHTVTNFLSNFGGNLAKLYKEHFPIRDSTYQVHADNRDNGPAIPVVWDEGSNEQILSYFGQLVGEVMDAGYVQFRAITYERGVLAFCPGFRLKPNAGDAELTCVGTTSNFGSEGTAGENCGDFGARDWSHDARVRVDPKMVTSVVMIFYK